MLRAIIRPEESGVFATWRCECSRCDRVYGGWELLERVPPIEPNELWQLAYWYLLDAQFLIDAFGNDFIVCPSCRGLVEPVFEREWLTYALGLECANTLVQPQNTMDSSTKNFES